jgi:hypothetical protein
VRFIAAIVLFVLAFVGIGLGIAERALFAGTDRVTENVELATAATVTVVDGSALNAFEGRQTLAIQGGVEAAPVPTVEIPSETPPAGESPAAPEVPEPAGETETDAISVTYGTTNDVLAWVGDARHTLVTWDAQTQELVTEERGGREYVVPSPLGSDLWYGEFTGAGELGLTVNVPPDVSLLIVSDGALPAPQAFSVTWPIQATAPLTTPLMIAGFAALILGLVALIWALLHMRRQSGPRRRGRKPPRMPRVPRPSRYRPTGPGTSIGRPRGRRAARRIAILPAGLVGVLVLGACSIDSLPLAPSPLPSTDTSAAPVPSLPPVAVSARQAERIIGRVAAAVAEADAAANGDIAATRLAGPAMQLRQANYRARANDAAILPLPAIPSASVELVLPQQTDVWPRQVFAIVADPEDETVPPVALVMIQATPREQYRAAYVVTLEPQASLPEMPPASLGTAFLGPDTPFLPVAPSAVMQAYADLLLLGEEGSSSSLAFSSEGDTLRSQIGFDKKEERRAALPSTASLEFSNAVGDAEIITMSTLDAGALVVGYLVETESVTPTQEGATVNASGTVAALANLQSSGKGITATYGVQVLFYVPSLEKPNAPIILLGYTQGLVAAGEVT